MKQRFEGSKRLVVAVGCAALALAVRLSLDPLLGSTLPYTFALGGVALAIYLAGWRASIVTAVVSAVWVNHVFVIPRYEYSGLNIALVSALVSYCALAAIMIFFGARASRALEQQLKANEDTRRALEAADRANEAWRAADRQKDEFISVLSHELRNPLGAISNAALVIRQRSPSGELAPAVDLLYRQVAQMRRLLDDLLDVARINRGLLALQRKSHDVRRCVQDAIDANAHLAEAARQEIEVVLPEEPVIACVDGPRITQIVSNLVNNATKYAGDGVRIEVRVERTQEGVTITVHDNGSGIEPSLVPHLFERFRANADDRSIHGLGLGLWISQSLAVMHGGRIAATSPGRGRGIRFDVCIPIAHEHQRAASGAETIESSR